MKTKMTKYCFYCEKAFVTTNTRKVTCNSYCSHKYKYNYSQRFRNRLKNLNQDYYTFVNSIREDIEKDVSKQSILNKLDSKLSMLYLYDGNKNEENKK